MFYEDLDRRKLWDRAASTGFPLAVAAVALNTYAARRFLGLESIVVDCSYPERGIAAGCGLATFWVQVYSLEPLQIWQTAHPRVGLAMFIDDLMGQAESTEEHQVVGR